MPLHEHLSPPRLHLVLSALRKSHMHSSLYGLFPELQKQFPKSLSHSTLVYSKRGKVYLLKLFGNGFPHLPSLDRLIFSLESKPSLQNSTSFCIPYSILDTFLCQYFLWQILTAYRRTCLQQGGLLGQS